MGREQWRKWQNIEEAESWELIVGKGEGEISTTPGFQLGQLGHHS